MTDDHSEPPDERGWSFDQLYRVGIVASIFPLIGLVVGGPAGIALFLFGFVVSAFGGYLYVFTTPPSPRFEVGTFQAGHQYNGVTITAIVEIQYDEDKAVKLRTVECAAVAEDGTTIFRENDTEPVGEKPDLFSLVGGDFDGVQPTTDHILAVSTPVHEYVDKWLGAGDNDPVIKATLETEFAPSDHERNRAREETRNR